MKVVWHVVSNAQSVPGMAPETFWGHLGRLEAFWRCLGPDTPRARGPASLCDESMATPLPPSCLPPPGTRTGQVQSATGEPTPIQTLGGSDLADQWSKVI